MKAGLWAVDKAPFVVLAALLMKDEARLLVSAHDLLLECDGLSLARSCLGALQRSFPLLGSSPADESARAERHRLPTRRHSELRNTIGKLRCPVLQQR